MSINNTDLLKIEAWLLPRIAKAAQSGGYDPSLAQRVSEIERLIPVSASDTNMLATIDDTSQKYEIGGDQVAGEWIDPDSPDAPYTIYRRVVTIGQLPAEGSITVAHNLPEGFKIVTMRGIASSSNNSLAIPSAATGSEAAQNAIYLGVGSRNVTLTVGRDRSNFTRCYVYIEYYIPTA